MQLKNTSGLIIVLVLLTAGIHLWLGLTAGMFMFVMNGLGYLVLLAGFYLPQVAQYRSMIRWALIAFAAVTVLAWLAIGDKSLPGGMVGYVDKVIEIILIVVLLVEARRK